MEKILFNLDVQLSSFELLGFTFQKTNHQIHKVTYDNLGEGMLQRDMGILGDIALLFRFFLGDGIYLEEQKEVLGGPYHADGLIPREHFKNSVLPMTEQILSHISKEIINERKIDILIFWYIEMNKTQILDLKLSILSQMMNVMMDVYLGKYPIKEKNELEISKIDGIKNILDDTTGLLLRDGKTIKLEKEQGNLLSIGLKKYRDSLSTDYTNKLIWFIKHLSIITKILEEKPELEERLLQTASQFTTIRNSALHSGNINLDRLEKKMKPMMIEGDTDTFNAKIRIYQLGETLVQNALFELLGVYNGYYYFIADKDDIVGYLDNKTFRDEKDD